MAGEEGVRRPAARLAARVLTVTHPPQDRNVILGDLEELLDARIAVGRRFNGAWYWAQIVLFTLAGSWPRQTAPVERFSWRRTMRRMGPAFRQAVRRLTFEWRYALAVIAIVSVGIGPAAAMLAVVEKVLLRPFDYYEPERIAVVRIDLNQLSGHPGLSPAEAIDLRGSGLFSAVETQTRLAEVSMGDPGQLVSLSQLSFTTGTLPMLGVQPILGRNFTEDDMPLSPSPNTPQRALLDYGAWQTHFGGRADVIGSVVPINNRATEIIGVLPNGFRLITGRSVPQRIDIYTPFRLMDFRNAWQFPTLAKVQPGMTFEEVQAGLDALAPTLQARFPQFYEGRLRFTVTPILDDMTRTTRPAMRAAVAGVLLLLLIACTNGAALVIANVRGRDRDIAIRTAIGASRSSLILELLAESVVLAVGSAVIGSVFAVGATAVVRDIIPRTVPRWDQITIGWEVPLYAAGLALSGLIFLGVLPVWRVARGAAWEALRAGTVEGGRAERPVSRFLLVGSQIALTVVLAFGCLQLARSASRLSHVDLGYDANVLALRVPYDMRQHNTRTKRAELYQRIRDRVRQVPGVESAGVVTHIPLSGSTMMDGYEADLSREPSFAQAANYQAVNRGYFETMKIPILQGRDFTDQEDAAMQNVIIVDETLLRVVFPSESNVIGRTLRLGWGLQNATIVGVVGHARAIEVGRAVRPQIYVPIGNLFQQAGIVTVRAHGDPRLVAGQVAAAIQEAGPGRAIASVGMVSDNVTAATSTLIAVTWLVTSLAISAGLLSAIGLYLVIAFVVHQRRRATAIRSALGATSAQVMWQHFRTSGGILLIALPAGVALSLASAPLFDDLVYGVSRRDVSSLLLAVMIAVAAGLAGTLLPVRRAARTDVVKVLRET